MSTTPNPPYYAVIFTSFRADTDEAYGQAATRMEQLAAQQAGFLGVDSVRENGLGITVSYWQDLESISAWKKQAEHVQARQQGKEKWYTAYQVRICKVERAYNFGM